MLKVWAAGIRSMSKRWCGWSESLGSNTRTLTPVVHLADWALSQGKAVAIACREAGISDQNCATNCSTVKSFTALRRQRSSLNNGATTTTRLDRTHHWSIGLRHLRPRHHRRSI